MFFFQRCRREIRLWLAPKMIFHISHLSSLLAHCSLLIAHCSADNDEHIIQVGRVGGDQNTAGNEDK